MQNNSIVPFNAYAAVEMVKQLRLAVDILRGSGELVAGVDYGKIPGTGDKDTLLLPGMEKLCRALNAVPEYIEAFVERDYVTPLFHYEYQCTLRDVDTAALIPGGRGVGLCNSMESGFRWRWVQDFEIPEELRDEKLVKRGGRTSEFEFAINKAETSGKYGKSADYWQAFKDAIAAGAAVAGERDTSRGKSKTWEIDTTVYRIPNPDVFDQVNAIMKRAKKRALGDAIKGAANVSAYFTVDMEDFVPGAVLDPDTVEGSFTVVKNAPERTETPAGAPAAHSAPSAPPAGTQGQERPIPASDLNGSTGAGAQGGFDELFPPEIGGAKVITLDNGKQVHRAAKLSTEPVPGRDVAGFPIIGGGKINMIDLLNKALAEKLVREKTHFANQIDLCIKEGRISDLEKVSAEAVLDAMRAHVAAKDLQREGVGR